MNTYNTKLLLLMATRLAIFATAAAVTIATKEPRFLWIIALCAFTRQPRNMRRGMEELAANIEYRLENIERDLRKPAPVATPAPEKEADKAA